MFSIEKSGSSVSDSTDGFSPSQAGTDRRKMPTWFAVSISFLLIYLALVVWAQVRFGSYSYALSYLRGSRLQIVPVVNNIGTHTTSELYQTSVTLRNHGSSPIVVVGASADCACIANRDLPRTVLPGKSSSLPITIRFGNEAGDWHQSITYLTDDPGEPALRVQLTAQIIEPSTRSLSKTETGR
jgi:hypothetical protein